jgi:histidinol phosphatase-like PHP family hydrolase
VLIDFHSHTTLSDGTLSVAEMVAAAERHGYDAYAITDHARGEDPRYRDVVREVVAQVNRLQSHTRVQLYAGVELTDFPPREIARVAEEVRGLGAQVVVVHGECVSLSVAPGTNAAAVRSPHVDILGHPGLISERDAAEAMRRGIFLEISARQGANWANGHVYKTARLTGALVAVDSDAHSEAELLSAPKVAALLRGAGGTDYTVHQVTERMSRLLLDRLTRSAAAAV